MQTRKALSLVHLIALATLILHGEGVVGDNAQDVAFFEKRIRPVLIEHCYECHAKDAKSVRGGLLLDSREAMRAGGESGAGVVPGQPDESLVLEALKYETYEMPPNGKLPAHVIRDFEKWIRSGAADPRDVDTRLRKEQIDIEQGKEFWSFQLPIAVAPPKVQQHEWPRSPLDAFIKVRLEQAGIKPASDADRGVLLRRAYYALIGLPPSPEELAAFLADSNPDAFAKVVDNLLDSQHFGERWGRHWLDVVRFAESSGGGRTLLFPDAWRYRDYVIEAFNADLPFDQFVREQLAGDLLAKQVPEADWQTRRRQLIATSFLLLGPTNYELQDKDILEMDVVDEQLDTIGKAFLGMTLGCARCHDHKFDPIPTTDYYAMAGILKGTKSLIHSNVSTWNKAKLPVPPDLQARLVELESQVKQLEAEIADLKKAKKVADREKNESDSQSLAGQIQASEKQLKRLKSAGPSWPVAMATQDHSAPADIPVAIRGVVHNRGDIVPRGVLQVALQDDFPSPANNTSGRLELADWMADARNPLTARVIVNRVWYWLFGEGLVRTVDNFGATGEAASHPELLDYLAVEFINDGYSIKRLIRRLMLSRTYQMSSESVEANSVQDSGNRLWWRMNRHRMEAESLRDTLMLLAGTLDLRLGGSNIRSGTKIEYNYKFNSNRRSVYVPVFRNTLPQLFAAFDFADPNMQVGKRTSSTIAPQALLLMNDPFVVEQCQAAGGRIARSKGDVAERIVLCFQQVLSRHPTDAEAKIAATFLAQGDDAKSWALLMQTLVQSIDFRYIQ